MRENLVGRAAARAKAIAALVSITSVLIAAAPATKPARNLEEIEGRYRDSVAASKRAYRADVARASKERVDGLRALQERAMQSKDADQVVALKKRIDAAQNEDIDEPDTFTLRERRRLEARLGGTRWHDEAVPQITWTLLKNGAMRRDDGHTGKWAAIGPNDVIMYLDNGWSEEWEFNDELTRFRDLNAKLGSLWTGHSAE